MRECVTVAVLQKSTTLLFSLYILCPSHLRGYIRCLSHPPEILTEVSADQHIIRHVASNATLAGAGVVVIFSPLC